MLGNTELVDLLNNLVNELSESNKVSSWIFDSYSKFSNLDDLSDKIEEETQN